MKRTLLLTALSAALLTGSAMAQVPGVSAVTNVLPKVMLGIKLGANFQELSGEKIDNVYNPGIVGGAFISVRKNKIGVRVEALVKSARIDVIGPPAGHINSINMDVPALFEYRIINRLWVQVGPQFTALLSAKDNSSNDVKKSFNTSDVSGVLGLEAVLPLHFTVGARYILGFSDVNNSGVGGAWRNRSIQVALGFRFI